jgi:hypothetical protein
MYDYVIDGNLSQTIMLGLQEKAHISLNDFRKGKLSATLRQMSPETPVADGDELDTLGGRTRLVARKSYSESPPLIDRSPTSRNPVIPFPISSSYDTQVHPSVVEYLQTFGNQQAPSEPEAMITSPSSQSYVDSSLFGLPPMLPRQISGSHQSPLQQHSQSYNHVSQNQASYRTMAEPGSFPQYFPVYDYAFAGSQYGYNAVQMDNDMANPSTSDANMHKIWQDFVAGLGMN